MNNLNLIELKSQKHENMLIAGTLYIIAGCACPLS